MDQVEIHASYTEIPTTAKYNKISFEGHSFNFDRVNNFGKKYWRCQKIGCIYFTLVLRFSCLKNRNSN